MPRETKAQPHGPLDERVRAVLDLVRPGIRDDGGDVEVVSTEGGKVVLRFLGACITCPSKSMTLRGGIERLLRERIPGIVSVHSLN
ncbi:MAG: NifU family protein [Planctomycetes bacterium]|nr:NifU family protein [Planctomycetota bacterium]